MKRRSEVKAGKGGEEREKGKGERVRSLCSHSQKWIKLRSI